MSYLIDGILLLDKPPGMSSNQLLQKVKRHLQAEKAGHTGALDPIATGVLPICLGEATKVSQYLLDSDKCYVAQVQLGVTTTTGDRTGDVLRTAKVPQFNEASLEVTLQKFRGDIEQEPSLYSALKQDGVPRYKLARSGKKIRSKLRKVTIYNLKLISFADSYLEIEVCCSKGTYIRALAEDIGSSLGCGAHIKELRRTRAGPFSLEQCLSLESVKEMQGEKLHDRLLTPDRALPEMPSIQLSSLERQRLRFGQTVYLGSIPLNWQGSLNPWKAYSDGEFIGLVNIGEDMRVSVLRLMKFAKP
jgi:tRNA pseudouridine55 synthase